MFLLRDDIFEITAILQKGGIVCHPTDTVWSIGCDVLNEEAIARIHKMKGQPPKEGYTLLVSSIEMLKQYAVKVHPRLETLLSFHQRPLTVIYDRAVGLPGVAKRANGSVAIQIAQDQFCQELIEAFGRPIFSTSANISEQTYPATFGGISSEIFGAVDYVVKYRQDDKEPGELSAIAKLDRHKELEFIRE